MKNRKVNIMLNQENYAENWEKALELVENNKVTSVEDIEGNMNVVYTTIAVAIVKNMSLLQMKFLGEITGIKFDSEEAIYDYVIKALPMDPENALKFGLAIAAEAGELGTLMSEIRSAVAHNE